MTKREAVIATLNHKSSEFVPGWSFFSTPQAEKLLLPEICSNDPDEYQIKFAEATGSCLLSVAGNLGGRLIEKKEHSEVVELDNGTRRLIVSEPEWFYETLSRPLDGKTNLDEFHLPDVNSYPQRWANVKNTVDRFHEAGFFVRGTLDGFYAGIWEHCRKIDEFLLDIAEGSTFAEELVNTWGQFMYDSAGKLLECDVDGLWWTDDLGCNTGPLMSPECYRKYFFPWHKKTAKLAHKYGKVAMMHSHGNINALLPNIVETGIDLLDPVGPSDGMDIEALKKTYGDRLSFSGGISRFIADMSIEQLRGHLEDVYRIGSQGGGFLPCEEGGVPKNMTKSNYDEYLKIRLELSKKYAQIQDL